MIFCPSSSPQTPDSDSTYREEFNASFCEEEEEDYYQLMKESHEADLSRFMEEWTANKKYVSIVQPN
jgi:hypothetical protein